MNTPSGRLAGKVALITGGAGNLGEVITRRYLAEGAAVIITGRNQAKLADYRQHLLTDADIDPTRVLALQMDGSQIDDVRAGVAEILRTFGQLDILVNNAGSAGAKRPLPDIPLTNAELQPPDTETLPQAIGNLLGISWNLTRAVAPHLQPGASIINISTIFSRTDYYGRIPYVVPKAALNALGQALASELGERGIRVNTIYPGPIASERINAVFQAMDGLKGQPAGSTATEVLATMRLAQPAQGGTLAKSFPTPLDIANAAVFLGSDESRAFSGHPFEVTHGMDVPGESRTTFVSRPGLRTIDCAGKVVLIWANNQVEDALAFADMLRASQAITVIGLHDRAALAQAAEALHNPGHEAPADMYGRPASGGAPLLLHLDPLDPTGTSATLEALCGTAGCPTDAIILTDAGPAMPLANASDQQVSWFLDHALAGTVASASLLARFWRAHPPLDAPRVLFVGPPNDGQGNLAANLLRAGVEQLIRVWRHESALDQRRTTNDDSGSLRGESPTLHDGPGSSSVVGRWSIWANQIIRASNHEPSSRDFAAAWAARLIGSAKQIEEINLYLPERLVGSIGTHTPAFGWAESLFGLHMGRVALITGGSAGIGGQIGRLLAMAGAQVMLAARNADTLEQMRLSIIDELRAAGYPHPERRVRVYANCDVGRPGDLAPLVQATLAAFGHVDYLINNAGIAGAEEMVVDMPLDKWRHTLEANLISNYRLLRQLGAQMKARGGYILNVSSYFGGEKYVAIPYPNRADYAVSKAGQRAMVESFARMLGPHIQINAIAPGPVEGDRLRGTGERPGLFARRANLILDNKRLNDIMAALFEAQRTTGIFISDMLPHLMQNDVATLAADENAPTPLRKLASAIQARGEQQTPAQRCLMNERIVRRLVRRLEVGGYLQPEVAATAAALAVPAEGFFAKTQIDSEASKVRSGIMGMLDLGKMPTEFDVALATVYYLADRNVTGETFHPSGGLKFDRTVTEGELFGKGSPQRLEKLRGTTVYLVGEYLRRHLVRLAQVYLEEYLVARVVLLTETEQAAREFHSALPQYSAARRFHTVATAGNIEAGIDQAVAEYGRPAAVICTPFRPLPDRPLNGNGNWEDVLSEAEFAELVEQNITHHFRVAQKVSLIDGANLVLVTPETTARSSAEEFALANFVKTSLHALTATLGAESERVVPHVPVNQVDLTRRARSEEPRNEAEEDEELTRFIQAVLLVSAPLPSPHDSRYRARIYRGNAITV